MRTEDAMQATDGRPSAEVALRVLEQVLDRMVDGFFALDDEWRFLYMNPRAEYLFGSKRDELIGRNMWEAFPALVGSAFYERFQQAMRDQTPVKFEEYYGPLDMWASVHALPSEAGLSVYLSDITSVKQTESALAQSEGQLRAVIDNSPSAIYMKDLDGVFIRVNDELTRIFKADKEWIIGKTDAAIMPEEDAREVHANDLEVVRQGKACVFEEDVRTPQGERIYLTSKFPLKDSSGRVYGVAGISTDVTERRAQERALAVSEDRFRKVFDEAPLGIGLADESVRFVRVNDRLAQMLGYSRDELVGMTSKDITAPEDEKISYELARQLMAGEIPRYSVDKRYVRKDGTQLWVSLTGALIQAESGERLVLGMVQDITERKRVEEAIHERDAAIREAYSDVIGAVTGGKLVLVAPDEMEETLCAPVGQTWKVDEYAEFAELRSQLADTLRQAGLPEERVDSFILATSEGMTNSVKHAARGEVEVRRCANSLQVAISDSGPGIDFEQLPKATLVPGFSTTQTLGMGFTIMLEICDRVLLTTQPGLTVLVLEATLDEWAPGVSDVTQR